MANYKDIFTGTINSIVSKVKDVAENGGVREVYEQGASRAKAYARIAKLNLELNGENEELKRVYAEIGKLYYEEAKGAPMGFFAPLFSQVEEHANAVNEKQAQIDAIKAGFSSESDIDVEISEYEDVVSADEEDKAP